MSISAHSAAVTPQPASAHPVFQDGPGAKSRHHRGSYAARRPGTTGWRLLVCLSLLAWPVLAGGCYDGTKLVEQVRSAALRTRLAEVDLGTYRTTMPHDPAENSLAELELHLFGTVPRYRVPMIEEQLKTEDYRMRHKMLATLRQATPQELSDPNFTQLRARIEKLVNEILQDAPVKTVGFYDVKLFYR